LGRYVHPGHFRFNPHRLPPGGVPSSPTKPPRAMNFRD
jgi:hypothetical protein